MSQSKELIGPIKPSIRTDKNIVYKNKKYPIDFDLFVKYSNYFAKNRDDYQNVKDIELKIDNYEIVEESVPMFISCCQNDSFEITDSNVFSLYQLSQRYEVSELTKLTSNYITKNNKSLIFQSINIKLLSNQTEAKIDLSQDEELISANFFEYINDDQLLSLPIQILYRIINNDHLQLKLLNESKQTQLIEFLFKCLDKYGRSASVLFLNIDIENERMNYISRLLTYSSEKFDFNMINSKSLSKSSSILMSEMQKLKIEYTTKYNEIVEENQKQKIFYESKIAKLEEDQNSRLSKIESIIESQSKIIDKYRNIKIEKIQIVCQQQFFMPNSIINLEAVIEPKFAFNDEIDWKVAQEVERTVEVVKSDKKSIVLKCLDLNGKVTVKASALDGSGVEATKELILCRLKCEIEVKVDSNQKINGTIKITEITVKLDKSKSKFILNSDDSANLGNSAYESGFVIDSLVKDVTLLKKKGTYYLHALVVDNEGHCEEFVSQPLITNFDGLFNYDCTGNVQQVELEAGTYKLEVWGAQGGCYSSTCYGGYGGYSTGTIKLASKTKLFIVVGKSNNSQTGGYNGGGKGGTFEHPGNHNVMHSYGGGGATHIGLKSGELVSFSNDFSSNLLIAAGGGGGAVEKIKFDGNLSIGGCGGGCSGGEGNCPESGDRLGKGATQNSGGKGGSRSDWSEDGKFGHGGNCKNPSSEFASGGGGGGFYGGGSGGNSGPGGGGSGYINTSKLTDAVMYGYKVTTSSSVESKTCSTSNKSSNAVSNFAKEGNGFARITLL